MQTKTNPKGCAALIVVGTLEVNHNLILTTWDVLNMADQIDATEESINLSGAFGVAFSSL